MNTLATLPKTIVIHSGKTISLRNYIDAWKKLKSIPIEEREKITVKKSLCTWYPVTVGQCLKQYTDGVHDRINQKTN